MIRLSSGPSRSMWFALLGCLVPCVVLANVVMLAIGGMFASSEIPELFVFFLLPLLLVDGLIVAQLVHHYRNTFWLDGRTLVRRGLFGRSRYDLWTARISAETAQPVWTARPVQAQPRLVVQVPGRSPVRLWLREPARSGAPLPPDQLAALARAVDPELRHPIARRLWEVASDPFGGGL